MNDHQPNNSLRDGVLRLNKKDGYEFISPTLSLMIIVLGINVIAFYDRGDHWEIKVAH